MLGIIYIAFLSFLDAKCGLCESRHKLQNKYLEQVKRRPIITDSIYIFLLAELVRGFLSEYLWFARWRGASWLLRSPGFDS